MCYITLATLAFGIALSSATGMILYLGEDPATSYLNWLPHFRLLLLHPQAAFGLGALLSILGVVCQPTRIR
ncbi:MAG: hypothetical protein ACE5EQ_12390 [Phycisphaerae bacterium]